MGKGGGGGGGGGEEGGYCLPLFVSCHLRPRPSKKPRINPPLHEPPQRSFSRLVTRFFMVLAS